MNTKQSLHTHCTFCDGKDTPEQIIETAIEKGFGAVGFSSHSYTSFSSIYTLKPGKTEEYKAHINSLRPIYEDKIDIFLGLEFDMLSDDTDLSGYDYVIGTVHSLKTKEGITAFDRSQEVVQGIIDTHFGGDGMAYAKAYFEHLSHLAQYGSFDILGHFDIITKHADNVKFFDEQSKDYMKWATDAMDTLSGKIPFFEVNTGAISRGYRKSPYPRPALIKELKARGFGAVITSDCHDRNHLDCRFDEAAELLRACGFKEKYILTKSGWKAVSL
ncbi:MAG: histidinol-phosphatase HisJ family protein [Clostridia bacterium]|nr:histidinol-phosphatase HisJ family protein [Clostridia bacterium]